MSKYILIRKKNGCPNCERLDVLLKEHGINIDTIFAEDNMEMCRKYNVRMVPCLLSSSNHETIFGVEDIINKLEEDNG